ncbi:MAG: hypothetical protein HY235_14810 [Acidobacteria bacterium]|nr:hypothetical protein [Acidobacteriota bacterium]
MSVWQSLSSPPPGLHGVEGDLLWIRVTVEAFLLEDLLEALAEAPFPINPEIHHGAELVREGPPTPAVYVEFPAWRQRIPGLMAALAARSFPESSVAVSSMLEEIAG